MTPNDEPLSTKWKTDTADEDDTVSFTVAKGQGLLLRLTPDGVVELSVVDDRHYPDIHPNCYAPADLQNVKLLHGGGSGAAVFGGTHSTMGSIVMKHAGAKDANEVFSLARIDRELASRSTTPAANSAAQTMKRRIPGFTMVYISCYHVRNRTAEPWSALRTISYSSQGTRLSFGRSMSSCDGGCPNNNSGTMTSLLKDSVEQIPRNDHIGTKHTPRRIIIVQTTSVADTSIDGVDALSLIVRIPYSSTKDGSMTIANGHAFLETFGSKLVEQLQSNTWKVTIGQKTIGGRNPQNGADLLTSQKLKGPLLDKLLQEFSSVIEDLDKLVLPQERDGHYDRIKREMILVSETQDVRVVSKELDSFTGMAIRKNFHPVHGRFPRLRLFGGEFRRNELSLQDAEKVPAYFLGKVLNRGHDLHQVFCEAPCHTSALDTVQANNGWINILELATQFSAVDRTATECIWTCGLTDAGLHNTFVSLERGLEIFDLGEPSLKPKVAFMTKFLMSFFHTPGMESDGNDSWKVRFEVTESQGLEKLSLTPESQRMVKYCHETFETTLHHFMTSIFQEDERTKQLLINYVVLQLLSDASFCLHRWEAKGGGTKRYGQSQQQPSQKPWLWRSLWDLFIASSVATKYLKPR